MEQAGSSPEMWLLIQKLKGGERPSNHNYIWATGSGIMEQTAMQFHINYSILPAVTRIHSWKSVTHSSVTNSPAASNWLRVSSKGQLHVYFLSQGLFTTQNMGFIRKSPWANGKKQHFSLLSTFSLLDSYQSPQNLISKGYSGESMNIKRQRAGFHCNTATF